MGIGWAYVFCCDILPVEMLALVDFHPVLSHGDLKPANVMLASLWSGRVMNAKQQGECYLRQSFELCWLQAGHSTGRGSAQQQRPTAALLVLVYSLRQELSLQNENHTASCACLKLNLEGLSAALHRVECDLEVEEQLHALTQTLLDERTSELQQQVASSNAQTAGSSCMYPHQRRHPVYAVDVSRHHRMLCSLANNECGVPDCTGLKLLLTHEF